MRIQWKPFNYTPETNRDFLKPLFQSGLQNQSPPEVLCKLARDISSANGHEAGANADMYQAILKVAPDSTTAWNGLAENLRRMGKFEEALVAAKAGLEIDPDGLELLTTAGNLYSQTHDDEAAVACLQIVYAHDPKRGMANLGKALLKSGKRDECRRILLENIDAYGHSTDSLALSFELSMHADKEDAVAQGIDYDLLQRSDQNEVFGDDVLAGMNRRIAQTVTHHPAMIYEPNSTATVKGKQTFIRQLLDEELSAFVIGMIQAQVERYIDAMPKTAKMPPRPDSFGITAWAVVLEEAGFQQPHFHPGGWLSGVYYVSAPDDGEDPDAPGAIEFGCAPYGTSPDVPVTPERVQPVTGQMLIFPSYFYHRTIPKKSATPRICISFDVY